MKQNRSAYLRALAALIIGVLLIRYSEDMAVGLLIMAGIVFFLTGVFSCVTYFIDSRQVSDTLVYDADGRIISGLKPSIHIAGMGSLVFGGILAFMPHTFINILMYILAALLILGAINIFFNLAAVRRYAVIGIGWWIMPSVLLIVGILALLRPLQIFATPYLVVGWALVLMGVIEVLNAIKIGRCRRATERIRREQTANNQAEEPAQDAEEADVVYEVAIAEPDAPAE